MNEPKRIVRGTDTRKELADRMQRALQAKPTTSSLTRQGLTPEELNKIIAQLPEDKRRTMQPIRVPEKRGGKQGRSIRPTVAYRPSVDGAIQTNEPVLEAEYNIFTTPPWFNYQGSPKVSIIVPLWKSHLVIRDQIKTWHGDVPAEIIYVDDCCPNNSKMAVLEVWMERPPANGIGKILTLKSNSGFGLSNNAAAKEATGEFLIFLNSDTTVSPDWI